MELEIVNNRYQIKNTTDNEWLNKYNKLVLTDTGTSLHHIIPRCKHPELKEDNRNHVRLAPLDHCRAHYYLWKYSREFALEFTFTYYWFRKHYGFRMTDEEEAKFKEDIRWCRNQKKLRES